MNIAKHTAQHLRGIHTGGNWTEINLKGILEDINWEEANKKIYDFNTIASLTYHITYYVAGLLKVLEDKPLTTKDALSFDLPLITSNKDWKLFIKQMLDNAEKAAKEIEKMPESKLLDPFTNKKYGTYFSNIHGMIEHSHYHIGQIALIKKMIRRELTNH